MPSKANTRYLNLPISLLLILLTGALSAQPQVDSGTRFQIDPRNSILRIYVGKAGPLARMGHNHVVHSQDLSGEIILEPQYSNSRASFSFPVTSLVVDATAERQRAGEGFESQPDESAISGTRENMLSEDVLHGEVYPEIAIEVTPAASNGDDLLFDVAIGFQGNTINRELPATLDLQNGVLSLSASFSLNHEDLGLSPFSAIGGALRVAEVLDFELTIEARAQ